MELLHELLVFSNFDEWKEYQEGEEIPAWKILGKIWKAYSCPTAMIRIQIIHMPTCFFRCTNKLTAKNSASLQKGGCCEITLYLLSSKKFNLNITSI